MRLKTSLVAADLELGGDIITKGLRSVAPVLGGSSVMAGCVDGVCRNGCFTVVMHRDKTTFDDCTLSK